MSSFRLPIERVPLADRIDGRQRFQLSSRIKAMLKGVKSAGASCNVYEVQDSLSDIADATSWAIHVLGYQGAPTLYLGNLRPEGSPISSGGTASGAVSFAMPFDAHAANLRRSEKKNGALQLIMPWNYKSREELIKFLNAPFDAAYRAIYVPPIDTPEAEELLADEAMLKLLAEYYDRNYTFLVKRPSDPRLLTNLCTEVEIPHRGTCVLGAMNAAAFEWDQFPYVFADEMASAAKQMYHYMNLSNDFIKNTPIFCDSPLNRQFGLGLFGLASFLGREGITYRQFADALLENIVRCGGSAATIGAVSDYSLNVMERSKAHRVVAGLALGYAKATEEVKGRVRAAFCFQPTVSTAHRSFDVSGYYSSPELQPVIGQRNDDAVTTLLKSGVKGDRVIDYHPATWTVYEVPYEDYADASAGMQMLINSTGLAHRHSHCYYGERFDVNTLVAWYKDDVFKHIRSLYYRHKFPNASNMKKDTLWQDTDEIVEADFNLDAFFSHMEGQEQLPGQIQCDCEG